MVFCPHCGEELAPDAVACLACGSDASTGWQEDAESSSVELPDPYGETPVARQNGVSPFAKIILLAVAVALVYPLFRWLIALPGGRSLAILLGVITVARLLQSLVRNLRRQK